MILGTVCSGIGSPELAASRLGWTSAWGSEMAPFARAVFSHLHPDTELLGDMTKVNWNERTGIDVLCAGTPCQSFSVAGQRGGLADARGDLTKYFFTEMVPAIRPKWVVWENVPGVMSDDDGATFGTIIRWLEECGYGWAYRIMDAQYFGVPQRRRRVFLIGCADDQWQRAGAVLFEPESMRGDLAPSREARAGATPILEVGARTGGGDRDGVGVADVAGTLEARGNTGGYDPGAHGAASGHLVVSHPLLGKENSSHDDSLETYVTHSLRGEGFDAREDGTGRGTPLIPDIAPPLSTGADRPGVSADDCAGLIPVTADPITSNEYRTYDHCGNGAYKTHNLIAFAQNQRDEIRTVEVAGALASEPGMKQQTFIAEPAVAQHGVRRLTPIECERLMGFPDNATQIPWRKKSAEDCPDGPRYQVLGNSMVVDVLEWLFSRIDAVDRHGRGE